MNTETAGAASLSTAAISALHQGNKIEAIKLVRQERNIGLKEAKDVVEEYVRGQPALRASFAEAQADAKAKALRWFMVLVALAIVVYYVLAKP